MRKPFVELAVVVAIHFFSVCAFADTHDVGFTKEDGHRMMRIEATLQTYMQQNDKRLSEMQTSTDNRFEQLDKRLEFYVASYDRYACAIRQPLRCVCGPAFVGSQDL